MKFILSGTVIAMLIATLFILMLRTGPDFDRAFDAYNKGDFVAAFEDYEPLANQGDAAAQFTVGIMYKYGQGVGQDHAEAAR